MITIQNRTLCEHCFTPISENEVCPGCLGDSNRTKYPAALPEGTILQGRYVIGKVLGKGGFGVTYLCYDAFEEQRVAIKEYLPETLAHRNYGDTAVFISGANSEDIFKTGADRFFYETQLVSRFNGNPNIISVYKSFYENNTVYYVMEYLEGRDLKQYIRENGGKLPEEKVLEIAMCITDALVIVHSANILHRDISPENIYMCNDGRIKLIDFGAARQVVNSSSMSLSVILKEGFAPLEQYQKKGNNGPWTDIYALGATLYYGVTGRFVDDAMTRLTDPQLDMTGISFQLAGVLKTMLEVRESDRYQSAMELKRALQSINQLSDGDAETEKLKFDPARLNMTTVQQIDNDSNQRKTKTGFLIAVIAVILILGVGLTVYLLSGGRRSAKPDSYSQAGTITNNETTTKPSESEHEGTTFPSIVLPQTTEPQVSQPQPVQPQITQGQQNASNYKPGTGNVSNGNGVSEYFGADGKLKCVYFVNYADEQHIYKMNSDTSGKQKITNKCAGKVLVVGDSLVFTNEEDDFVLYRMTLSGDSVEKICNDQAVTMYADGQWIYYRAANQNNCLFRIKLDGTNREQLNNFPVSWFMYYNETLYFNDSSDGYYYSMKLDGSKKTLLTKDAIMCPTFYNGRIYYSDGFASIWSMNPDGSDLKELAQKAGCNFNLSGGKIYYFSINDEYIYSMSLSGTNVRQVKKLPGMSFKNGVDFKNNAFYITEKAFIVLYGTETGYTFQAFPMSDTLGYNIDLGIN
ncbi:MAG: DUF5050 domain-containing protein [Clostridiales bacterium]|nr:DUF5050 domain-containing protein [Clostridiales bacterium]